MIQRTYIGLYDTEASLIAAMEELDHKGIAPKDMYIIAKTEEEVELLRRKTYDDIQSAPSNWIDRFIGYISGENHIRSMLVDVGFDEADLRRYEAEIKQGKWLLYVEGEPEKTAYEINAERGKPETNPFGKPRTEAEHLNEEDKDSAGIGKDGLPRNEYRDSVMEEQDEAQYTAQDRRFLGKVGAEALFDKTDYEPPSSQRPSSSLTRRTADPERKHLHLLARQERRHENPVPGRNSASKSTDTNLPHPGELSASQMDRQDSLAEMTNPTEQPGGHVPMPTNHSFGDVNQKKDPIIIDLRGIKKKRSDADLWLIQDEDDFIE